MVSESEEVSVEFPSHPPPPTAAAAGTSSDAVSEKQIPVRKTQRRSKNKKEDKVNCEVCGKLYSEITEKSEIWIQCSQRGCNYWTHPKCHGFNARNESYFEKISFYCPRHRNLH